MKVLLIAPPDRRQEPAKHIPMKMLQLAALTDSMGYVAGLMDMEDRGSEMKLRFQLGTMGWDAVVMQAEEYSIDDARVAAGLVRKQFPKIRLAAVSDSPTLVMEKIPEVDLVMYGDPEETFKDFLHHVYDKDWKAIPGIFYRRKNGYASTPPREPVELDSLPFPNYEVADLDAYFRNSSLDYCAETRVCTRRMDVLWQRDEKLNSPDYMIGHVRYLRLKYAVDFVNILDEDFLIDHGRAVEFAEKYRLEDFYPNVKFGIRFNPLRVEGAILSKLKDAGCVFAVVSNVERYFGLPFTEISLQSLRHLGLPRLASSTLKEEAPIDDVLEYTWLCICYGMKPWANITCHESLSHGELLAIDDLVKARDMEGLLQFVHDFEFGHDDKWKSKCPVCGEVKNPLELPTEVVGV